MTATTLEPRSLDAVLEQLTPSLDPGASSCEVLWATVDGERVVVKAGVGRARATLRREAEALERIGAPGLVAVVRVHETESVTALVSRDAGQHTLEHPGDASAELLLRALQHTCRTVDELHRSGWSHGRLTPDHVIVGARGRVRLCSLGAARPTTDRPDGIVDDLRSLRALVAYVASELEAIGGHGRTARRLQRIAEVTDGSDGHADSPAVLAERVGAIHRGGHGRPRWSPRWPAGNRSGWLTALGVASAALALGAAAISLPLPRAGGADAGADAAAARVAPLPVRARADVPRTTTSASPAAGASDPAPTVVLDGSAYRVGLAGDVAVAGDWDCDGTTTVRLLRPQTGELFEFGSDGSADRSNTGTLLAVVEGATELRAQPSTDPGVCDRTVTRRADGTDRVVP